VKKAVVFGAGNIGRSFITPVLQGAGYGVTIVDLDESLISMLNSKKEYRISICSREGTSDRIIKNFQALALSMESELFSALQSADLVATSVGLRGFNNVCALIGKALPSRISEKGIRPLDFILAENIHGAGQLCRDLVKDSVPSRLPLEKCLGVIETSIGKMVPAPDNRMRIEDPLRLMAEPYNTLILDRDGFLNDPPCSPDIQLVSPIQAYVDRKLYIHNLGHAATAYLGRMYHPGRNMIWEVLEDDSILKQVRSVMMLSARALALEYPGSFTPEDLEHHVDDLIGRFRNQALGDSVQRVGRDLKRKLAWNDRICGAANLILKHSLPPEELLSVYRAAVRFGLHPAADDMDRIISEEAEEKGIRWIFDEYSNSSRDDRLRIYPFLQSLERKYYTDPSREFYNDIRRS